MPKVKISEYSTTNSNNTDINSINIDEGCAPSGINNAIREVMVHLRNWQTNASGDGATFASLVVQGTGSFTGAVTMSAGATLSGTNTLSGSNIMSGNINSSGSTNTFSGGVVHSGTNTFSSSVVMSGNINSSGTNTFSGSNVMSFSGGSSASPSIYFASDTNTGIFSPTADTIAFTEGGAEAMRIDSSGNVLVGTTTTRTSDGQNTATVQIQGSGTGGTNSGVAINSFSNNAFASNLDFFKSRGTGSTNTIVQSSDNLGKIYWSGADGTGYIPAAAIQCKVDGTPGTNDMPGRLEFSTTADGGSSVTERMRIDSSGNVLVGITSARANAGDVQVSKGISFPATQSAQSDANTLDDYEEGTWTPTIIGGTTAGTASYSEQVGNYTKIGRVVYIRFTVDYNSGTGTGILRISGLPFTVENKTYVLSIQADSLTLTASHYVQAVAVSSTTEVGIQSAAVGTNPTITNVSYDASAYLRCAGFYFV